MHPNIVTVFGSSRPKPSSPEYAYAQRLGALIAESGWTLCNGGYGGTMEASARGAVEAGGHTIGITCTEFGRSGPNEYIRQEVPSFELFGRIRTLIQLAHAYVVLPGGTGTLAELGLIWELSNKGLLRGRRPRPLIVAGEVWRQLVELVRGQTDIAQREIPLHLTDDLDQIRSILGEHHVAGGE